MICFPHRTYRLNPQNVSSHPLSLFGAARKKSLQPNAFGAYIHELFLIRPPRLQLTSSLARHATPSSMPLENGAKQKVLLRVKIDVLLAERPKHPIWNWNRSIATTDGAAYGTDGWNWFHRESAPLVFNLPGFRRNVSREARQGVIVCSMAFR